MSLVAESNFFFMALAVKVNWSSVAYLISLLSLRSLSSLESLPRRSAVSANSILHSSDFLVMAAKSAFRGSTYLLTS